MRDIHGKKNPRWNGGSSEYPNHSEFKRVGFLVLKDAKGLCEICSKPAQVVHHLDFSKDNHARENLVALCDKCHFAVHSEELENINGRVIRAARGTSKYMRLYGATLQEIAAILGCSTSHVFKMHRASESNLREAIAARRPA